MNSDSIIVVGCGGVGSWVAYLLALEGKDLIIYDSDIVEKRNIGRGLFSLPDVGKKKGEVIRDRIGAISPSTEVILLPHVRGLPLLGKGVIFDCTDSNRMHKDIFDYGRRSNRRVIRVSYDGRYISVGDGGPGIQMSRIENPGYQFSIREPHIPAMAASLSIATLNGSDGYTGDIRSISNRTLLYQIVKCDECDRGDCNDCDRGDCNDCERRFWGDCNSCDRGDCNNCDNSRRIRDLENEIADLENKIRVLENEITPLRWKKYIP